MEGESPENNQFKKELEDLHIKGCYYSINIISIKNSISMYFDLQDKIKINGMNKLKKSTLDLL
jgi:hypothetical protein